MNTRRKIVRQAKTKINRRDVTAKAGDRPIAGDTDFIQRTTQKLVELGPISAGQLPSHPRAYDWLFMLRPFLGERDQVYLHAVIQMNLRDRVVARHAPANFFTDMQLPHNGPNGRRPLLKDKVAVSQAEASLRAKGLIVESDTGFRTNRGSPVILKRVRYEATCADVMSTELGAKAFAANMFRSAPKGGWLEYPKDMMTWAHSQDLHFNMVWENAAQDEAIAIFTRGTRT